MPTLIKGENLTPAQRQQVLAAFIYRWTHENPQRTTVYHCDKCDISKPYENSRTADGHTHPTIPLIHDGQWLKDHAFWFNKDGTLTGRSRHAEPAYMADADSIGPVLRTAH